jgi:hypothetical protein
MLIRYAARTAAGKARKVNQNRLCRRLPMVLRMKSLYQSRGRLLGPQRSSSYRSKRGNNQPGCDGACPLFLAREYIQAEGRTDGLPSVGRAGGAVHKGRSLAAWKRIGHGGTAPAHERGGRRKIAGRAATFAARAAGRLSDDCLRELRLHVSVDTTGRVARSSAPGVFRACARHSRRGCLVR